MDYEKISKLMEDAVDEWHAGDSPKSLVEYLGMTWSEYVAWVDNSANIPKSWQNR